MLERRHNPDDVPRAVDCVRRRIGQLSLDLIFGVPGQTPAEWDDDLNRALALEPDHVSTYGLTYEKGTRLWKQRRRGEVRPLDEDTELTLYTQAMDTLTAAGFEQYEISNFARPGRRSRHNQVYWANHAYYGFGVGAARYVHGRRELNTRNLDAYLKRALAGEPATVHSEELGPEERARETIAMQLRRAEGIERVAFKEQTGFDLDALVGEAVQRHAALELVTDDGASAALDTSREVCRGCAHQRLVVILPLPKPAAWRREPVAKRRAWVNQDLLRTAIGAIRSSTVGFCCGRSRGKKYPSTTVACLRYASVSISSA